MSAWLLSIVGVVALGVLIEIIMPEGEHSKYIKGIFSLVVIFVIVSPFPKLLSGNGYEKFFDDNTQQIQIDVDSYESIKDTYRQNIINNFDKVLEENGYSDIDYVINFDEEYVYRILNVSVSYEGLNNTEIEKLQELIRKTLGNIEIVGR